MTATNDCGSITTTETITITTAPSAAFSSNVTSGCALLTVEFSNQSSPNVTTWNWSFPGGTPSNSTEPNPTVTYDTEGTYSVTLEVGNASGITTELEQSNYIVIDDVPSANFTSVINGMQVDFW